MTDDMKAAERYLTTFAVIAPLGIFVALLFEPTWGGAMILAGLATGCLALHRLGRLGPVDRL